MARAALVQEILERLYPNPQPSLHFYSPFTLLVAVVLSAQCTDLRVNQATERLFKVADTPQKMAALTPQEIYQYIFSLGLAKSKAQYLARLSQQLVADYGGQVPSALKELEKLAGVGHKTASVVSLQAFGIPAFPVDTHIFRCARRWGLSQAQKVEGVERDLKGLYPAKDWGCLHLQIISCGRQYCKAQGHDPGLCPVCSLLLPVGDHVDPGGGADRRGGEDR